MVTNDDKLTNEDYEITIKELVQVCESLTKNDRLLFENKLTPADYKNINEGLWEKAKYYMSKLGRYKAGGKIFGKGKTDKAAAAKIQAILDKKGNELVKLLNDVIKEDNPEFPNNKDEKLFLDTVTLIASVYDSIVAGTKKNPDEKGFLPVDAANSIIEDLAEYTKKFLDVDLKAAYSVFDSKKPRDPEEIIADEYDINEDEASDTRKALQVKGGDVKRDSQRMNTLKSNKLPLMLGSIGSALGAFGWITHTQWFKDMFTEIVHNPSIEHVKSVVSSTKEHFVPLNPGDGPYRFFTHQMGVPIDQGSNPQDLIKGFQTLGGGDAHAGVKSFVTSVGDKSLQADQLARYNDLIDNPDKYKNLKQFFYGDGQSAMGGKTYWWLVHPGKILSIITTQLPIIIPKLVVTAGVKTAAGYGVAKGLGSVLGPIGVALVSAGILVKAMRMKGQKQSRAKTLNDLLQSLQPLKGEGENVPVINPPDEKGKGGKSNKKQMYNSLTNFFQFIVNNQNVMGGGKSSTPTTRDAGSINPAITKRGENMQNADIGESDLPLLSEGKYIQDKRTLEYLNKSGDLPFEKVKKFEEFITRLEQIRNVVRKMSDTDDKVINGFVAKMQSNPIMATDFVQLFNIPSTNPDGTKSLRFFILELFKTLYAGQFKFGNIIDKMKSLGSGNINKPNESVDPLAEDKGYNAQNPNKNFQKDAQSRASFKKHLVAFITELMNMYQYLYKLNKEGKLGEGINEKTGNLIIESGMFKDKAMNEELNRIKELFNKSSKLYSN